MPMLIHPLQLVKLKLLSRLNHFVFRLNHSTLEDFEHGLNCNVITPISDGLEEALSFLFVILTDANADQQSAKCSLSQLVSSKGLCLLFVHMIHLILIDFGTQSLQTFANELLMVHLNGLQLHFALD